MGYSHFVDYAVLMDEPYLLAHYVYKDQTSGFESEWISWREIKKRHSGRELKQLLGEVEWVARRECRRTTPAH